MSFFLQVNWLTNTSYDLLKLPTHFVFSFNFASVIQRVFLILTTMYHLEHQLHTSFAWNDIFSMHI